MHVIISQSLFLQPKHAWPELCTRPERLLNTHTCRTEAAAAAVLMCCSHRSRFMFRHGATVSTLSMFSVLNWSWAHSTDFYRQIRDLIYSHIRRMCPALWEEPVGTQQLVGPLWLSAPLFLWMMKRGWLGLLWVLHLGEPLHAGEELLLESWHKIQKATPD